MKKCRYCGEEIQDEAVRCRFCGSDLRAEAPPVPGLVFTHLGTRYVLGFALRRVRATYVTSHYGIWDATSPGPPVARFENSDEGWRQAQEQFTQLEPNPRVNESAPACPDCGSYPMAPLTGSDRVASMATGFAVAGGLGALLASSGGRYRCPRCGHRLG